MYKFEALIVTGKLEVRFQGKEALLKELENFQKYIAEDDFVHLAISFGKLDEMIESAEIDVSDYTKRLYEFISQSEESLRREQGEKKLDLPLEELQLSVRAFNCLMRAGKRTVRDIVKMSEKDLRNVRNLDSRNYDEVIEELKKLGLNLRSHED